jgi:hypothetical protein
VIGLTGSGCVAGHRQGYGIGVSLLELARLRRCVAGGRSDAPGPAVDVLGRVGLVGYGVVHLVVAWSALQIALGSAGVSADAQGAVAVVAQSRFGGLALGLGAAGLLAFALWQLSAAVVGFRWVRAAERTRKRAGAVAKALATSALAGLALRSLLGRRVEAGNASAVSVSAEVLALPGGRVVLGLAATVILVLAAGMVYTALRCTFMGDLEVRRLKPLARQVIAVLGAVGHLARATALAVVGLLLANAAVFADPERAGGLDAALRALGDTAPGSALLIAVGGGFAAYGVFCLADAATRRA